MDKSYRPRYDDNRNRNKRKKRPYGNNEQQNYSDTYNSSQSYGNQGYGNQSYNNQNYGNQGYNTQRYDNRGYNRSKSNRRPRDRYDDRYIPRTREDEKGPLGGFLMFLLIMIIIVAGGWFGFKAYNGEMGELIKNKDGLVEVEIGSGANTEQVAKLLQQKGLVEYPIAFRILSKLNSFDGRYKTGKHLIKPGITYEEMMAELVKAPPVVDLKLTIPEGFTIVQIVERLDKEFEFLNKEEIMKALEIDNYDYEFLKKIPKEGREDRKYLMEGYLYPETYFISEKMDEEDVIKLLLSQFEKIVKEDYYKKAEELGYTMDEIITIASIIERETKVPEEAKLISGVIHKRLKTKPYILGLCSTIQYISICNGKEVKEHLETKDTEVDDPYNTYKIAKLPPGPICSPGKNAIEAALYPENPEGYLYFVAKGDGSREHFFAKTLWEHNQNKAKYDANIDKQEKSE